MTDRSEQITATGAVLAVTLDTADGALAVRDARTGRTWRQAPVAGASGHVVSASRTDWGIDWVWHDDANDLDLQVALRWDAERATECTLTLDVADHEATLSEPLRYPHPFVETRPGAYLVVPMNEGISYPVDDAAIEARRLIAYGGHGICMAFWGVTAGQDGSMALIETADDAAIAIDHHPRHDGALYVAPEWDAQKGRFGYARKLRYVFLRDGGYVAMAKRYREYADNRGLLVTLRQKREAIPATDRLIGAVNVWYRGDRDKVEMAQAMYQAGIKQILWSAVDDHGAIRIMNDMGLLTSRYDMVQDVMDPAMHERVRFVHRCWPTEAWPQDLMIGPDGEWIRGWEVPYQDHEGRYPCGVVCDRQAPDYLRQRMADELEAKPYNTRFIDTTTATPWRECYSDDHPLTRSGSRAWKMQLLDVVSGEFGLVCGSETGHDAAVPYVHYFEGMLSLGPYRVPDAGRRMAEIWDEVPERVATFQLGHAYRLPLWELVYHDCVCAHWYWGDYNNKLPALWDKRDLFNVLYGTAPMFMFEDDVWQANKARFVQSYHDTCHLARAVGYHEMIDHRLLTADRAVQQSVWANGVVVTVNFGDEAFTMDDATTVEAMGYHVRGLEAALDAMA